MKETKHRSTRWALGIWALVLAAALLLAYRLAPRTFKLRT